MKITKTCSIILLLVVLLLSNCMTTNIVTAARYDRTETVQNLIDEGADVHRRDRDGKTALMYAQNPETVRLLLDAGADLHALDKNGMTAFMYVAHHDRTTVVQAMLDAGADVNARDERGWTPLMHAAGANAGSKSRIHPGDAETTHLLIKAGADVNAQDKDGRTALMYAAYLSVLGGSSDLPDFREVSLERVGILLEAGADVNAKDNNNQTALMRASNYTDMVSKGFKIEGPGGFTTTARYAGAEESRAALVRLKLILKQCGGEE